MRTLSIRARSVLAGGAIILLLVLTGCAHYQLGTGATPGFQSVYLAPVENSAGVPQAVALVSRELRLAFARDGRVSLAGGPAAAEAEVAVALIDYRRDMTAVRPADTALARKFDVTLTARLTLTHRRTGQVLIEPRDIAVTRQIFTDHGQIPAEYQVLPQLAAELGDRVTHAVLDVW